LRTNGSRRLAGVKLTLPRWIGDWLNYGEQKYGGMYKDIEKLTGLKNNTLRVYKYVASRIGMLNRINNLQWQHHRLVAKLSVDQQTHWLDTAENGNGKGVWKVKDLRRAIEENNQARGAGAPGPPPLPVRPA